MFPPRKSVLFSVLTGLILSGCQNMAEKPAAPDDTNAEPGAAISQTTRAKPQPQTVVTANDTTNHTTDNTTEPDDLWALTRSQMNWELYLEQPRVQSQLNWYKKHPDYMKRVVNRAAPYYYHILTEAIKRDIPVELALLPIIESAFDPFAYSHGRAAGPWQFIPSTGKHFGLKQNWWYDGRRDIIRSTDAAFTYLEQLNKRFDGDWLLAVAAYNAGGGNVSLAVKRNKRVDKPIDFWSLNLPQETMAYVPKLLAVSELIKNSKAYGLELPVIPNEPYFAAVDTQSQIDLAQAAEMAGITTKELYLLNPAFNRWATDPKGPHQLLVPVANAGQFETALAALPKEQRLHWTRYKVKSGDSLIVIAKKFNTTVDQIRQSNKLSGNSIRVGQALMITTASQKASEYALSKEQRHAQKQKTIARTTDRTDHYYRVKAGDSFWSIAKQYQVGVRQLAQWNSMAPGDALSVGKRLVIWSKPEQNVVAANDRQIVRKVGYKVRSGDSLYRIADKFNIRVADIMRWNKIAKSSYLKPGQHLTLYVDVTRIN